MSPARPTLLYTGKQKQVGKEGQVARFGQRFGQFFSKGKEKQ